MKTKLKVESSMHKMKVQSVELQTRYNFTFNFLVGAAAMAKKALEIENTGGNVTESERLEHTAFVAGCIMQSVAALESEAWSLLNHGPGHHIGSNGLDKESKEMLSIVADTFEKEPILRRFDLILQLIRKDKLDLGAQPMQDLSLVINLRNNITHFKSLYTKELDVKELYKALEIKDSKPPSFNEGKNMNFFPHICLTFNRAKWSLDTVVSFIESYYAKLKIKSPLEGYNLQLIKI